MLYSAQALRFHAMLQQYENSSVLTMAAGDLNSAVIVWDKYVERGISVTLMSEVVRKATLLVNIAGLGLRRVFCR